jgi:nucleotide-binding universal stress UspA family protein
MTHAPVYERIILGYDGSEQARDAFALARLLAANGDRSVVVAYVLGKSQPFEARTRDRVMLAGERSHAVLDPVMAALDGVKAEARPIESPSAARGLHELVEEEGASLVVIGSTHRGPIGRVLVGSVGELLLSGTPASVAVAPRGFADRGPGAITTISAGFNGTEEGLAALRTASALASDLRAKLRAIAVDEGFMHTRHQRDRHPVGPGTLEDQLAGALADAQAAGAERVFPKGDAASGLADACSGSDLLVIGSRSYGPVHHTLLGSVSAKLMRSCPAPLLVVPRSR